MKIFTACLHNCAAGNAVHGCTQVLRQIKYSLCAYTIPWPALPSMVVLVLCGTCHNENIHCMFTQLCGRQCRPWLYTSVAPNKIFTVCLHNSMAGIAVHGGTSVVRHLPQ